MFKNKLFFRLLLITLTAFAFACGDDDDNKTVCGNGVLESGETCDAGDQNSDTEANSCRTDCTPARCGDSVIDVGEDCDDGDSNSDTVTGACHTDCQKPYCGDGNLDEGEICDDGESNSDTLANRCREDCTPYGCGDGVKDGTEECDEGDANSDEGDASCRVGCLLGGCGDGILDTSEECDDGDSNSDSVADACRTECLQASCGDKVIDSFEACDDGTGNSDEDANACRTDCLPAFCGDAIEDTGEECDAGEFNTDDAADLCRTSCLLPACSDGIVDTGEECDDGNGINDDSCTNKCLLNPLAPVLESATAELFDDGKIQLLAAGSDPDFDLDYFTLLLLDEAGEPLTDDDSQPLVTDTDATAFYAPFGAFDARAIWTSDALSPPAQLELRVLDQDGNISNALTIPVSLFVPKAADASCLAYSLYPQCLAGSCIFDPVADDHLCKDAAPGTSCELPIDLLSMGDYDPQAQKLVFTGSTQSFANQRELVCETDAGESGADLIHRYILPADANLTITARSDSGAFLPIVSLASACDADASTDNCDNSQQPTSKLELSLVPAGTELLIWVGGEDSSDAGDYELSITFSWNKNEGELCDPNLHLSLCNEDLICSFIKESEDLFSCEQPTAPELSFAEAFMSDADTLHVAFGGMDLNRDIIEATIWPLDAGGVVIQDGNSDDIVIIHDLTSAASDKVAFHTGVSAAGFDGINPTAIRVELKDASDLVSASLTVDLAAAPPTLLRINEIVYDGVGGDAPHVFTELWGPPLFDLTGYSLVAIDGEEGDGQIYRNLSLDDLAINESGYLVLTRPLAWLPLSDLSDTSLLNIDWQNGPGDIVQLVAPGGAIIDALQYGTPAAAVSGEGAAAAEANDGQSLSRDLVHSDTDDNATDFMVLDTPTPAAP